MNRMVSFALQLHDEVCWREETNMMADGVEGFLPKFRDWLSGPNYPAEIHVPLVSGRYLEHAGESGNVRLD